MVQESIPGSFLHREPRFQQWWCVSLCNLGATLSGDPDVDAISFHWFYYKEAGTFPVHKPRSGQPVQVKNFDQSEAWFTVPTRNVMEPGTGTTHFILAVTDHGSPRLIRSRRVIVKVVQ